nr:MAG TPA: hypothetical protein [Caudoviricetes sp.]
MAQRINRRLSRIENFFSMLLTKGKISDNIFVGELPPTTSKNWDDFVNVDVGQQREHGGYSSGYANIYLYARPKGTPLRKNVKLLDKMEGILDDVIKHSNNKDYTIQVLYRDSGYDSNRQFHFQIISVSVIAR